jgi:hypothetical protein
MDAVGHALAVWEQEDADGRSSIWANRYAGRWGTAALIGPRGDTETAMLPQVAFDAAGNAIAIWMVQGSNGRNTVWANRFE